MTRWPICSEPVRLLAVAALLVAVSGGAAPASRAVARPPLGEKTFAVNHRGVDEAYLLLAPFLSDRSEVRVLRAEHRIVVRDEAEVLAQIERELAAFDVAQREVWVSIRIVKGERRDDLGDRTRPAAGRSDAIPPDVSKLLHYNTYEVLGSAELTVLERSHRARLLGGAYGFRVDVHLGRVDARAQTVDLELLSLERRLVGPDGGHVFSPVIQFSDESLAPGRTRVLLATPAANSGHALFLLIEIRLKEGS